MIKKIVIKGAKEHNLKNVSVEIPKDQFVVITGLSGSGKSSLAFDTIYAEGQRRYVESLSAYARQFLDKMKKPNVDLIEGLSPAIAIEQKNTSKNPRSTVATVTEIYDYMRVLYARAGVPYSPFTGKPITSQTITQIVDLIKKLPKKSTIYIYAPVVRGRKGEYRKDILSYKRRGFRKIKIDEVLYDIDKAPELDKKLKHDISVLVDRIVLNSNLGNRLAESIETAVNLSNGLVFVEYEDETLPQKFRKTEKLIYSTKFACPESGFTIEEIEYLYLLIPFISNIIINYRTIEETDKHKLTFIAIWVLLSFPIVHSVTKRLKQDEEFGGELPAGFQIYLFIRAQFHVPTFYLIHFIGLFLPNKKD